MGLALVQDDNPDAVLVTFEMFWGRYPRRVAKKEAEKAWKRIDPSEHPKILAGVEKHRKSEDWTDNGGKYVPYPATYLNNERWTDELEGDLSMGECCWNRNGNREPGKPKCTTSGSTEKNGIVYCQQHARMT